MARVRMVTRTVKGTKAEVMCLDTSTAKAFNLEFEVGGTFTDNAKLLKVMKDTFETETLKLVHIVSAEEIEQLYGMPESDFIAHAQKLPPRGSSTDDSEEV